MKKAAISALLLLLLAPTHVSAQDGGGGGGTPGDSSGITGSTTISFDANNNKIIATCTTQLDLDIQEYYRPNVRCSILDDNGNALAGQTLTGWGTATVTLQIDAQLDTNYTAQGRHYAEAIMSEPVWQNGHWVTMYNDLVNFLYIMGFNFTCNCPIVRNQGPGPAVQGNVDNLYTNQTRKSLRTPPAPQFDVEYASFIAVDHVTVPSYCFFQGQLAPAIYKGDGGRGTVRTREVITLAPDTGNWSNFQPGTGLSDRYAWGSPANGSTLSAADEDHVPNDCYFWDAQGQAPSGGFTADPTFPAAHRAQVHFVGAASDPIQVFSNDIDWDVTVVINTTTPANPTATITYSHDCYPDHQVKVNGTVVYHFAAPDHDYLSIGRCLAGLNSVGPTQIGPLAVTGR